MNSSQCGFSTGMELATIMAVAACFRDFFKAIIGPELERGLRRKPTDWDWQVYWEESAKKAEVEASQRMYREWQNRLNDRKLIHDFVWRRPEGQEE